MKLGMIGAGNMASALLGGMLKSGVQAAEDVCIFDTDREKLKQWAEKGVRVCSSNSELEAESDFLIFAVKPKVVRAVVREMTGYTDKCYLSIAAGVTVSFLEKELGGDKKIIRAMPNTPALVGCGMTVLCTNENVNEKDEETALRLMQSVGDAIVLSEAELEVSTALHGSSPAYVYMMIDAMADEGVRYGIPKNIALHLAAKAVEGSAKMVLETGIHPQQLKDDVCSPGGTTIAAVSELEKKGFVPAIQAGIEACVNRNAEMKQ